MRPPPLQHSHTLCVDIMKWLWCNQFALGGVWQLELENQGVQGE
jgi:hypothetical protein